MVTPLSRDSSTEFLMKILCQILMELGFDLFKKALWVDFSHSERVEYLLRIEAKGQRGVFVLVTLSF